MKWLLCSLLAAVCAFNVNAADKPKRLLLVTHSGGFIHDSVGVAEDILKEIGPKHGYEVTCWRYTGDTASPDFEKYKEDFRKRTNKPIESENCGHINKDTLKNFDVVLFFTTGSAAKGPVTPEELKDLEAWVKAGGAFCGTHCATDTLYKSSYGDLIGGYFRGHPAQQELKLKLEDPKHPAAAGMTDGMPWKDEWYVMQDTPYSREKLHIILSIEKETFKQGDKLIRTDGDYAVSWCKQQGKGKVFYTSLGHRKEDWIDAMNKKPETRQDLNFLKHLFGGIDWSLGIKPGDSSPSKK